ncbi:MAG: hypothetical protein EPN92_10815 [Chitinophagaceae bacterium]|nr:MAG: hypothetical protein EPN92_10815 [Chitinophagaceae bacterium]
MQKTLLFVLLFFGLVVTAKSQKPFELGPEYMRTIGQQHNASIAGFRGETFRNKSSFSIGLTYHFSDSYSSSKGFGIYGGYRYGFSNNPDGNNVFAGIKILFSLVSWEGKSSLFSPMMTPIAEVGYHFIFAKNFFAAPAVGCGYTIRVIPDNNSLDEDVGGRIIPSISAGYRF